MKKLIKSIIIAMLGVVIGVFGYLNGIRTLFNYAGEQIYSKIDLCNLIFITSDFNKYDYMDEKNFSIYFILFVFSIIGIIVSSKEFLLIPKSYHSFIYMRYGTNKEARKKIKGRTLPNTLIYSLFYFLTIYILSKLNIFYNFSINSAISEHKLVLILLLNLILKVSVIELICSIIFIIYIKKNSEFAFVFGAILIFIIICLDLIFKNINFILFDYNKWFIDGIIILNLFNILFTYIARNKIKNDVV